MKVAAPAMNQSIPYFDHRPSSTSGEFSAAEFVADSNVYSTNSGSTYQVSNAPTQISAFSTALEIKPDPGSSLSNNSPVTATLPSGLRVSTPSMLSIPSTVSQPQTMQVVINQNSNLPNGSHIVITPQRDGDQPLYVQYVVPADNTGNGAINLGGNTITDGMDLLAQITDSLAGPSNSASLTSVTGSSKKSYRFSKKNREHNSEKESFKKAKQAEAARLRYHRLNADEKKALNLKRTQAQKRKRQREKEMAELESILRETNDIIDDPHITEQLREKRIRARWAEAARSRYQRMSSEERRAHNVKRRMRQLTVKNEKGEVVQDHDAVKEKVKEQNTRKALAARTRYHRMTPDEKKFYNQRRTEAFRRRRLEEEALLAMPIGRINGEALDRAQQIVVRNAKRAEAARLRYQRMTPEERKAYNQKRYTPKRRRESPNNKKDVHSEISPLIKQEEDALTSLERDVIRRTQQAQQVIRQRGLSTSTPTIVPPTITDANPRTLTLTLPHVIQPQGKPIITSTSQNIQFPQNGTIVVQAAPQPQLISAFNGQHPKIDYS
uniref:Uncharacterized protein n=1 Tax=Panagrolaimus sp. ES5 TaxID=591445 RepID=A0AC34EZL9_9BILA